MTVLIFGLFVVQAALENHYVRVARDSVHCASASSVCKDRVLVAMGDVEWRFAGTHRRLRRGEIAVFGPGDSYSRPTGSFFEVTIKADHPPVELPPEHIPAAKNVVLHDGERLFIFEERLAVGDIRERHSHNPRVVIQLNRTRLEQWPDGEPAIIREIEPDRVTFNPAVIHRVRNIGALPLRGIVIELKGR